MSFFRKNPLFAIVITVCCLLVVGELAFAYERYAASRAASKRLAERKSNLEGMSQLTPPPTRDVAKAIEADLTKAKAALESMQGELKGRGPAAERIRNARIPVARTDAYFDLATFVEKTRESARKHEVEVRPEAARFGFASFANEGPVQDHIEPVFRQRQIAQYLVESLIEAKPRAILSIRRERTLSKAEREARAAAAASGEPPAEIMGEDGPDYFTIDPRVSARNAGFIDTMTFKFVFTGQTAALRTFLNRLASFELPVLVREVEVDPATPEEAALQAAQEEAAPATEPTPAPAPNTAASVLLSLDGSAGSPATPKATSAKSAPPRAPRTPRALPIVAKPLSKFTVTVEFIELVTPTPPAADGAAPAPAPTS